jgi:hypothetical protein
MRRIFYASGSFITSDVIAAGVLNYADALTRTNGSDVVNFPIVHANGSLGDASVLIGPASQIASASEESELPEPVDDDLLQELERKTLLVGVPRPLVQAGTTKFALDEFE